MARKKVKITKADYKLRKKTGVGEISPHRIDLADEVIRKTDVDFIEVAEPILERLKAGIAAVDITTDNHNAMIRDIVDPVMEFKANGKMFKYDLVSHLAGIMLGFLEQIHTVDKDARDIITAHERTLSMIISKKMAGEGGVLGPALCTELNNACERYYRKNPDKFKS